MQSQQQSITVDRPARQTQFGPVVTEAMSRHKGIGPKVGCSP